MEYTGFEPVASTMRMLRAPNCANTPYILFREAGCGFPHGNNGARTHDLPLVRRALSQLSYVSNRNKPRKCSPFRGQVALMEITSKNYQRILEFKLSNMPDAYLRPIPILSHKAQKMTREKIQIIILTKRR